MSRLYVTQLYGIVIGLGAMVFMLTLDYRTFTDKSHLIYIGLLALLSFAVLRLFPHSATVHFGGFTGGGAKDVGRRGAAHFGRRARAQRR